MPTAMPFEVYYVGQRPLLAYQFQDGERLRDPDVARLQVFNNRRVLSTYSFTWATQTGELTRTNVGGYLVELAVLVHLDVGDWSYRWLGISDAGGLSDGTPDFMFRVKPSTFLTP